MVDHARTPKAETADEAGTFAVRHSHGVAIRAQQCSNELSPSFGGVILFRVLPEVADSREDHILTTAS
jgi:hypothetical protein